ncbi:transmembrane protein 47-like [Hemiscyllium ocellatum]|uniref:transmembrane protein 47-like n=1 Tax=Hemiscyllium ocellatum TaxID=170820 RepID=UPI002967658D|nr:transmembrane protein 47-like [Hemiscyllium ocellatum]
MAVDEVRIVRPFKLIALICVFVALSLDVVSLLSPAWVTAERSSLSLWDYCKQTTAGWYCVSVLQTDWQVATLVLLIAGGSITLIAFLFAVVLLCKGVHKRCYRSIAVMLFISVVLQVCALVLYPIKFIDANTLRTYHEFNWGYGIAWGGTIFMLGAAILYCLNTDNYEEEYY